MSALNAAEAKFFETRGQEVDASLTAAPPPEPPPERVKAEEPPKPAEAPKAAEPPKEPEASTDKHVPLQALQAERQKRQQAEQERQHLMAQLQEMQRAIQEAKAPQPPSLEEDPIGALAFQNRQLQEQLQDMARWREQQQQVQQQQQSYSQFTQHVAASEAEFAKSHPDYTSAADFAVQQYDRMLQASIPDPAQRQMQIRQVAAAELARVVQQGANPAEFIYNFARSMGYQGPQPAAPAAAPSVPDAVKAIERGLKQASNISGGGAAPPSEMTPEMLAAIKDPAAFNAEWKRAFRR